MRVNIAKKHIFADMGPKDRYLSLIHPYWIRKYALDRQSGVVERLPARRLLVPDHFDLFARLFYIRKRKSRRRIAAKVYLESQRCFTPFGKEWGQEDVKGRFFARLRRFDEMIDHFSREGFDNSVSLVVLGKDNYLLDGSHRVAALAFYGKDVTVCRFDTVEPDIFCSYTFFLERGMPRGEADRVALEALDWLDGIQARIIWPGESLPETGRELLYRRDFRLGRRAYRLLRARLGLSAPEKGTSGTVCFLLSQDSTGTQDPETVRRQAECFLTRPGRSRWLCGGGPAFWATEPFRLLTERNRADFAYLRFFFSQLDNSTPLQRFWTRFYRLVSRLWKRG